MANIVSIGHITPIGMRVKVEDPTAIVINTCAGNDTAERGTLTSWVWCNPTNRVVKHPYHDIIAVSVECLWQGCKLRGEQVKPDPTILSGNWRAAKGRKPIGAYAGPGAPLIVTPGEARRAIYIPAFQRLVDHWLNTDDTVLGWVEAALKHKGPVYLRDHDTGRGLDRNGPLSHAWILATYLNTFTWPN